LSPAPHEDLGRPYPDPKEHNQSLEAYAAAIRLAAERRRLPFVDLFRPLAEAKSRAPDVRFSTNGILLGDAGYWKVALEIERQLGLSRPAWRIELGAKGDLKSAAGIKVWDLASRSEALEWKSLEERLPAPLAPLSARTRPAWGEPAPVLVVAGLAEGQWILRCQGQEILSAPAREWEKGVSVTRGPSFDQVEAMRRSVAKRNNLYTRRWRPVNDWPAHYTYIAPDFALYDGLVAEQDELVATQSQPVAQSYALTLKKP
jgi:hypothetical protein